MSVFGQTAHTCRGLAFGQDAFSCRQPAVCWSVHFLDFERHTVRCAAFLFFTNFRFVKGKKQTMTNTERLPKMMTIRQVAATGLLPETALRRLAAENRLPALKVGNRLLINLDLLIEQLNGLGGGADA